MPPWRQAARRPGACRASQRAPNALADAGHLVAAQTHAAGQVDAGAPDAVGHGLRGRAARGHIG